MATQNFNVNALSFEKQLSETFNTAHDYFDDDSNNTALSIVALPLGLLALRGCYKIVQRNRSVPKVSGF